MNLPATTRRTLAQDWRDMNRLMSRMFVETDFDRMFDGGDRLELATADWTPSVDVEETENSYLIKAELPQMKKEEVKIAIDAGVLTISGERRKEKEEKGKRFHRVERSYGTFFRSFRLPDDVDQSKVDANFADGVLNVTLPKSPKMHSSSHEVKIH